MKKAELITKLEAAKELTSVVTVDTVIELINELEDESDSKTTITPELADIIIGQIELCLDRHSGDLVDLDSAEFELTYDSRIELNAVNVNVYDVVGHVSAIISKYIKHPEEEEDEFIEVQNEAEQMQNINQGLGLEPEGNPYEN